jgi:hypothetical protein
MVAGAPAGAAIVPTVQLATAEVYSVLGGSTVTNTGASVLNLGVGLSPGTAITGFPPGQVVGVTNVDNAAALQAKDDLTAAYLDAEARPVDVTTTAQLDDLVLVGGVYAGPGGAALSLTGPLVLDGQGDPDSVFIFQTDSTLTTASASTVELINGAQECNVFWQVGSSATLGSGSMFVGTILALTSVTVNTGVTVHGRALARNGAVTLDTDVFEVPTCDLTTPTTTTTTTTTPSADRTMAPPDDANPAVPGGPEVPPPTTAPPELALTGAPSGQRAVIAAALIVFGLLATTAARARRFDP